MNENTICFTAENITIEGAIKSMQMAIDGNETRTAIYNLAIQALREKQARTSRAEERGYQPQARGGTQFMEKYSWSFRGDDEIFRDGADIIEDCIALAKEEDDDAETVYIGENVAFSPSVDAERVLDDMEEQADDFCAGVGGDWAAYDRKTMQPELEELSAELTAVTMAWLKKNGRGPKFCSVEKVRAYSLLGQAEEG